MESFIDTNKNNANCYKENIKITNNNNNYTTFTLSDGQINGSTNNSAQINVIEMNQEEQQEQSNIESTDEDGAGSSGQMVFHNEGLIEEIILLPNNLVLSDDESNSDDCIYAYRGVANSPEQPAGCNDDETDFLEMDFDPEPNSELENFNDEQFNHLESNFFSLTRDSYDNCAPNLTDSVVDNEEHPKNTGAKPKTRLNVPNPDSFHLNKIQKNDKENDIVSDPTNNGSCLDCAEIEFIKQTKPDAKVENKCTVHCPKQSSSNALDVFSENSFSTLSLRNDFQTTSEEIPQFSKCTNKQYECMVTIYSVNCDYETIVEATNSIGLNLNTEIIRQHYEINLIEEDSATSVLSVPEYLLYISKRNCNYKKLVDLIKSASSESIDIHFYPVCKQVIFI